MLSIKDLTKTYSSGVQALRGVSLELSPGVFGLLGPNGSGKTTLMKIVATLLEPDSGTIEMNGADLIKRKDHTREMLGYLPQDFGLYPTLTAWQMLDYLAKLKGVNRKKERHSLVDALLERVNLASERSQRLGEFSGGMRQRLGIAQALIGEPQLIIVDEPTAGLDPEERLRFHNLLSETANENTVVILSTHIVSDVSNLCSRMAIIRKGKILAACSPRQAVEELKESVWEGTVPRDRLTAFKSEFNVISLRTFDGDARVRVISNGQRPNVEFTQATAVLEDYYFDLVNRQN
ncbi:MAG TPA: ABC transporter ATP-binding protein [Pyrinomonadaceae bacterium]|jgi:ABC-type multidrug transport system ATPase subunit|nr:ABC transporter ATP-binding protein [Pyrinomonadaceae bacterium]